MALANGPTVVAPIVGQVLAEVVFPWPRSIRVILVISTTYPLDILFETWDGNGQVMQDMVLPVNAPLWSSPTMGPFTMPTNGRFRVLCRSTPEVTPAPLEVQANIFWRDWAER